MRPFALFFQPLRRRTALPGFALAAVISQGVARAGDPYDAAEEAASLRVADGYEVSLFASERDGVVKPIQIRFDGDGRLWVSGSRVYPQIAPGEAPKDQILVLEPTADGSRVQRSTVFADGLMIPTGLEVAPGGALVGAATELLLLQDTDGDGRADRRQVLFSGFGVGDAHQTLNSFTWGPGGELMMSQGLHAESRVETPWGVVNLRQAGVWRLWLDRRRLEPFWSGAMGPHNPFGTVFDRWGQPLVVAGNGHGIYHLTPAMIPTEHFREQPALWNQGRKFGGADFVENSHWPDSDQGQLISGGYLQNTVERFKIADNGATFRLERLPPLIESTNNVFRIVDARFGPDGSLYLCDWCNSVIGHYQASFRLPERDKTHGRIWRVTAKGRPPVGWKKLGALAAKDLAPLLASPERWNRQLAKRALAAREPDAVAAALSAWLATPGVDDHARFEALGAFVAANRLETNLLATLAHSPAPEARAYAARVVGHWSDRLASPLSWLAPLAADPHPRVRLEAVVACAACGGAGAVETAAIAADFPFEPAIEYAFVQCVQALEPQWRDALAAGKLQFAGKASRQAAFARALEGPESATVALGRLRRAAEVSLTPELTRQLSQSVAAGGSAAELPALLNRPLFGPAGPEGDAIQAAALDAAAESSEARGLVLGEAPAPALRALLSGPLDAVRPAAIRLAGAWRVASLRTEVEARASDAGADSAVRRAAVRALGGYRDAAAARLLAGLATGGLPASLRADAVEALAGVDAPAAARPPDNGGDPPFPPPAAAGQLGAPLPALETERMIAALLRQTHGPELLRAALEPRPPNPANAAVVLSTISASGRRDAALASLLNGVAGAGAVTHPRLADIPAIAEAVRRRGDAERGRAIFERPQLGCAQCHSIDGTSGRIGPDLSALGRSQTVEFILGAILEPQKEVKEGFMAFEVEVKSGELFQGFPRAETPSELIFFDHLTHREVRIPITQVVSRRQLGSLMPDGLADSLTADDLRDLATFLSRLGR